MNPVSFSEAIMYIYKVCIIDRLWYGVAAELYGTTKTAVNSRARIGFGRAISRRSGSGNRSGCADRVRPRGGGRCEVDRRHVYDETIYHRLNGRNAALLRGKCSDGWDALGDSQIRI